MKLAHKLWLSMVALIAILFSVYAAILLYSVFNTALKDATERGTDMHGMERYMLESELLGYTTAGQPTGDAAVTYLAETMAGYLGSDVRGMALFNEAGDELFTSLPEGLDNAALLADLLARPGECQVVKAGESHILLFASSVQAGGRSFGLLSGYNITGVFSQRTRNLVIGIIMELILLAASSLLVYAAVVRFTRPLAGLTAVSRRMAGGSYDERVCAKGADEVAQLAQSFNEMAAAVQRHVEQLNLSVKQRDDFVSAFTHEIKTPMTTLVGFANLLRTTECAPDERQRSMTAIYHEAKRLEALSQKLLALMGLAEQPPTLAPVPLQDALLRTRRALQLEMPDAQNAIGWPAVPEGLLVAADGDLLVDLLLNLLHNAKHATRQGGKVWVELAPAGDAPEGSEAAGTGNGARCRCTLAVCDTGRGIPDAELARITEAFYTVDKSRSRAEGGSGLGLALADKIAVLHGGPLRLASKLGQGTRVSFTLALWKEETDDAEP